MKFANIEIDGRPVPTLYTAEGVYDLQQVLARLPPQWAAAFGMQGGHALSTLDVVAAGDRALELGRHVLGDTAAFQSCRLRRGSATRLLAPLMRPPKNVFCLGRNYAGHIQEDNEEDNASRDQRTPMPEYPQFFTKPASAVVGDGAHVRLDERVTRRLDYEVGLAVVIGRGGRDIPAVRAMEHVFGYTIVNDVTARDLQHRHGQWFKGKALDTCCPMGPWIVTADEIADPHALTISLEVNGEMRQHASTAEMIFRIPQIIESLSAGLTLESGDVIATGTPAGVGYAMNPRRFLASGDVMVCRVEGIGSLTNTVIAVPAIPGLPA